jgi:hypothetical protein
LSEKVQARQFSFAHLGDAAISCLFALSFFCRRS